MPGGTERTRGRLLRRIRALGCVTALTTTALAVPVPSASAAEPYGFSNLDTINIPIFGPVATSGPAFKYPSDIVVSNLTGTIADVDVLLRSVDHGDVNDLDIALAAPNGRAVLLLGDGGFKNNCDPLGDDWLTFDDESTRKPIRCTSITTDSYQPNGGTFDGTPAPSGPWGTALSTFDGLSPNGTWSLYVYDLYEEDAGEIGGWEIFIRLRPTITSFSPASGSVGTAVIITGTKFTGASSVKFGSVSAAFDVDSDTQITATVPAGASTGPIKVNAPDGTATSATDFIVTGPTITSFKPKAGKVGTSVTITGINLDGTTAVAFNGVSALFRVDSDTQVTVDVPEESTTGPVSVTTASGTGTSAIDFVVKHKRTVTLKLGAKAKGSLAVLDGFAACARRARIKLQHLEARRWTTVARTKTSLSGAYALTSPSAPGSYRALAPARKLKSGDVCLKAVSTSVKRA